MENRIVFRDKEVKDCTNRVLGVCGENEQETLIFLFEDEFVDGTGFLEIEFPSGCCGRKCSIELEKDKVNECYKLEVKNSLLRFEGTLRMQLKIVDVTAVWKSIVFEMIVDEAINATETIEEDYPDLVKWLKTRMQEIEQGFEQLDEKVDGIEVPTKMSDLENDEGFLKEESDPSVPQHVKDITEADIEGWNGKSDFSGDYEDLVNKPVIPSIEGLATEAFVEEKIGEIDLTGLASEEYVNGKIGDIESLLAEV